MSEIVLEARDIKRDYHVGGGLLESRRLFMLLKA